MCLTGLSLIRKGNGATGARVGKMDRIRLFRENELGPLTIGLDFLLRAVLLFYKSRDPVMNSGADRTGVLS